MEKQNQAYDDACSTYGVERRDGILRAYVVDGKLADSVVRLAQAITAISQSVDVGQQLADVLTEEEYYEKSLSPWAVRAPGRYAAGMYQTNK